MKFERKFFDPLAAGGEKVGEGGDVLFHAGPRPQDSYVYTPRTVLAINVALATRRPLLVSGEPGSGKTTLVENAAEVLGWHFYKQMVTSRIQAADLLWTFDTLSRLNDSTAGEIRERRYYVEPGALWWAASPTTAVHRGLTEIPEAELRAADPGSAPSPIASRPAEGKAVVLLDEIDKADPDVPNDLLEPLDIQEFTVRETNDRIRADREILVAMTTNGERELPPAFMRRCVSLTLEEPSEDWLVHIAGLKYPQGEAQLHRAIAREVSLHRATARKLGLR